MKRFALLLVCAAGCVTPPAQPSSPAGPETHALWIHPWSVVPDAGKKNSAQKEADMQAFVAQCAQAGFDLLVPLVKYEGYLYWHSKRFPELVHPDFKDFDFVESMTRHAHAKGLKVHAWFCDFIEIESSRVVKEHPEWCMLNPDGKRTTSEMLNATRPYWIVWMCPAQRPGYVDGHLIPLWEDLVRETRIDGGHHDYIRYPGDVAPDHYCYCDYCVDDIPRSQKMFYSSMPDHVRDPKPDMPRPEASWHRDYTIRPSGWDTMSRADKAKWLLGGKTMKDGPVDLNYFFYEYRVDAITRYKRLATARTRAIRPEFEWSAAVFKNPYLSGRNIGQRWTDWTDQVDQMMPMNYRSHFPVEFERFLTQLEETVKWQKELCGDKCKLLAGIDASYIYKEEAEAADEATRKNPPAGYYPESKLIRTIEACRKGGADGIVIFCAANLPEKKLWGAVEKSFAGR